MLAPRSVNYQAGSGSNDRLPQTQSGTSLRVDLKALGTTIAPPDDAVSSTSNELITYIFPDFKAVEYFRKEFVSLNEFHLLEKTESAGFEIYLVDQWIRDRKIGSVASVFTGNAQSKVKVCKFTTTKKQSRDYSPRFQEYLNELLLNHATFKKMDLVPSADPPDEGPEIPAYLLVTNISAMPHNLFLIPIPDGDASAFEHRYMVNSNLKKLDCGGRSLSLLADKVSDASEDKFRQMYCILNESVPIHFAILELVNLVQTCLFYFDLLDAKYADGLLCHKTEDAIANWWNLIGLPHFNSRPTHKSGVLSLKTVAAIISLTVSVKLRLQLIGGCDVPKDIFDAEGFMISIGHFQKQVKIEKRRKLNLLTLSRLFYYTNQSTLADKLKSFYSPFGSVLPLTDSDVSTFHDQTYASPAGANKSTTPLNTPFQGQAASAYRRNKIYCSKELKKLTNVVKNTVQDHIMVKEDQDDIYADLPLSKPTTKLRSKIASKLSDTLEPAEIETTDIEVFAKKCIVGKTLLRLWIGLSLADAKPAFELPEEEKNILSFTSGNPAENGKSSRQNGKHNHHRLHWLHEDKDEAAGVVSGDSTAYGFLSFRDSFSSNQDLHQVADKSGRLGRMKLSFQNRRGPLKLEAHDAQSHYNERYASKNELYNSLLDAELLKLSDTLAALQPIKDPETAKEIATDHESYVSDIKGDLRSLNRRNSFPIVRLATDANLNTVEALHHQTYNAHTQQYVLKKSASFSALEEHLQEPSELACFERMRIDYVQQVSKLLALESLKRALGDKLMDEVTVKQKLTSFEAHKIQNTHALMLLRKQRFEAEYEVVLGIRMKDLADNLDKMAFRSRDLLKKIDELDEHLSIFEAKLQSENMARLDGMIDKVLRSTKFEAVFEDQDEKALIVKSLTGAEDMPDEMTFDRTKGLGIQRFIVFLYELFMAVLGMLHFDRSRINFDRIRSQYNKLDPEREYISKVYTLLGHEPSNVATESGTDRDIPEENDDRT